MSFLFPLMLNFTFLYLLYVPLTNWVLIYNVQIEFKTVMGFEKMKNTEEPQTVFAGKIKNKSELKTLMEWLQID